MPGGGAVREETWVRVKNLPTPCYVASHITLWAVSPRPSNGGTALQVSHEEGKWVKSFFKWSTDAKLITAIFVINTVRNWMLSLNGFGHVEHQYLIILWQRESV